MNYGWIGITCLTVLGVAIIDGVTFSGNGKFAASSSQVLCQTINPRKAEADRLLEKGSQLFQVSQYREALQEWEQALQIYREIKDRDGEGGSLNNLGNAYNALGQYQKAIDYYQQSLAFKKQTGDRQGEGNSLNNLGLVNYYFGKFQKAIDYYQQSLAIFKQIGDRKGEGDSLNNFGLAYNALGQYQKAIEYYQQSLELSNQIGDRKGEGGSLNNLGNAFYFLGQYQKAIEYHQQSLAISKQISNRSGEGNSLGNLGNAYNALGQYQKAIEYHQQSLAIKKQIGNRSGEGNSLGSLGLAYNAIGQYQKAIEYYKQSLAISKQIGDLNGEGGSLNNLGLVYKSLGQYQKAIEYYQQSLTIFKQIGNRNAEGSSLNNLGLGYYSLGQYQKAIEYYQQSLTIAVQIGDRNGEGYSLNNLGLGYYSLGQYQKAIEYYQQSLTIKQQIGDRKGEGNSLGNLGSAYKSLGQYQKAIEYHQQSLTIAKQIGDRSGEGNSLDNLGAVYTALGQYQKAIEYYQQSLTISKQIGDRESEGRTFSNLGNLLAQQKRPELAIVFYKQSVKVRENIRRDIQGLDKGLRQSYTETVASTYRSLADLLLQQNRVMEALQVLDLLKLQELEDFFKNMNGDRKLGLGMQLLPVEQQFLSSYQGFTDLKFEKNANIISFLQQLQQIPSQKLNAVPSSLQQIPKDSVLLYPVIFDQRVELVLFAPDREPIHYPVSVSKSELETTINDFRSDLSFQPISSEDANNAKNNGQKLYKWLIQPLEADLSRIKPQTIIYAPDGRLRYIPLAALFDGKQWLIEKYRVNNIVAYNLTDFNQKSLPQSRVLAGAFGGKADENLFGSAGLPGTLLEVESIAATMPDMIKLLGSEFNLKAIETQIKGRNVIHFATHARFVPGTPEDSYILLGNGDKVTLRQVKDWKMSDVNLVVLSACQTGLGGLKDGVEILGLGYQFQVAGSKATISSLWKVSDAGTQVLMNNFYTNLKQGNLTKAQSLRQAQISLIKGQSLLDGKKIDHPFFWSSFILIGNGL